MKPPIGANILFHDRFEGHRAGEYPDGWRIEQQRSGPHRHAELVNGAYSILAPGNKHLPLTGKLTDFCLAVRCRAEAAYTRKASFVIYFRYDPDNQAGGVIRVQWGEGGISIDCGLEREGVFQAVGSQSGAGAEDMAQPITIRLAMQNGRVNVAVGEISFEASLADMDVPAAGYIAFDRGPAIGHLLIEEVKIECATLPEQTTFWPERTVAFPANLNGMDPPVRVRYQAVAEAERTLLYLRLEGGLAEQKPGIKTGYIYENDVLRRPYVRIEERAGHVIGEWTIVDGTVGFRSLTDPREPTVQRKNFIFYPATAELPLETTIVLPPIAPDATLILGYEWYEREMAYALAGGPSEMAIESATGRIIYAGAALPPGVLTATIQSPADKALVKRIVQERPADARAIEYARMNHYFMVGEAVEFTVVLRGRHPQETADLTALAKLENVYHERMGEDCPLKLETAKDELSRELLQKLGVKSVVGRWTIPKLPMGVYHVTVEISFAGRVINKVTKAFEVLGKSVSDPAPPQDSGLPVLLAFVHEFRDLRTDAFDPWLGWGVDTAHYMAASSFPPEVAQERSSWNLIRQYRRKAIVWLSDRTTKTPELEANADLVANCDILWTWLCDVWPYRWDLWKRSSYREGAVLDIVRRFAAANRETLLPNGALAELVKHPAPKLSPEGFKELVERHWKAWVRYACDWMIAEVLPSLDRRLKALNKSALRMSYATIPIYAAAYKSAYFSTYTGFDLRRGVERYLNGPLTFEDYPYEAGYPLQRGIYTLTTMKLEAPAMRVYPEIYGGDRCPIDAAFQYGHPPDGGFIMPGGYLRKRMLETVYATVWFGRDGFQYWRDDGFVVPTFQPAHFEALLATWRDVQRHRAAKPLRTAAFAYSRMACELHPDYWDHDAATPGFPDGDIYNTAEECVAFAFEQSRHDGQQAGFVLDLDWVAQLSAEDVHTLVLPPIQGLPPEQIDAIRRLHEQGVSLICFERVDGLEDLFGVAQADSARPVRWLSVVSDAAESVSRTLAGMGLKPERTRHPLCQSFYKPVGARVALAGGEKEGCLDVPVLLTHQTQWGHTAFFTVPPTVVCREKFPWKPHYGRPSTSQLMNLGVAACLRWLGHPVVETSAGKLIGFRDIAGHIQIIVEEDAYPAKASLIQPLVTIHLPGIKKEDIRCDRPFVFSRTPDGGAGLRLALQPEESAWISIQAKG